MNTSPSIYITELSSYNNGRGYGAWVDMTQDIDDIWKDINKILADSPEENCEEWAIHDHEGFEGYSVSEHAGIAELHEVALFIDEHGELGAELLGYYPDVAEAKQKLEDNYHGCYKSLADYAQEMTESGNTIPDYLEYYIDYERMGRDWSHDLITIETDDGIHIFF